MKLIKVSRYVLRYTALIDVWIFCVTKRLLHEKYDKCLVNGSWDTIPGFCLIQIITQFKLPVLVCILTSKNCKRKTVIIYWVGVIDQWFCVIINYYDQTDKSDKNKPNSQDI